MKILIADDDPIWRRLLQKQIRDWGHDVVLAENGDAAWDILQAPDAPRLAILDWMMPGLDGLELCRRIRRSPEVPFIYTIILTGKDSRRDRLKGMASGADDFMTKPVDAAMLSNRLAVAERILDAVPNDRYLPGFELLERLGAGAMATVYKARQTSLDRLVAVKILPQKYTDNEAFVERFYAEGRAAAKLNHPNIVAALDVGKTGDRHYFAMEYLDGHTVFEDIVEKGPYEEAEALRIAIQIAKALEHAHNAGFMHRDVKPKNIMITKEGVAKLTDLGLARAVSDREAAKAEQGRAFGTPYYISPEQARGRTSIDFRADIYCFGATLYHMVTGQVPFKGPDVDTVMRMHLEDELVPPDHINSKISRGMAEVIEVCMAKRRRDRYANTSDLVADLEALAVGDPPLQARKVFDLSALAPLREEAEAQKMVQIDTAPSVTENPLFLPALLGWLLAVVLAIALILVLVG